MYTAGNGLGNERSSITDPSTSTQSLLANSRQKPTKKRQEDEQEENAILKETLASLEGTEGSIPTTMTFVSGGTFNPSSQLNESDAFRPFTTGRLVEYRLTPRKEPEEERRAETVEESSKPRQIDELLEEFKRNQERRARKRDPVKPEQDTGAGANEANRKTSFPTASNLRLGNLNSRVTPEMLTEEFSCYGAILSTKVMVPRPEDTKGMRNGTCGFVLFAQRVDAERAKSEREGTSFHGNPLIIDWAPAPDPQSLAKIAKSFQGSLRTSIATSSSSSSTSKYSLPKGSDVVYVVPPHQDRSHIDNFALWVAKEGPEAEARTRVAEAQNPSFGFLFKDRAPEHIYYQWRLESLRRGESMDVWKSKPLRLVPGGPFLIPPPLASRRLASSSSSSSSDHLQSPMDLIPAHLASQGEPLTDQDRTELEELLRNLSASRGSINAAMTWVIDHEINAPEIVQTLSEALTLPDTKLATKLGRLFLVSDILSNARKLSFTAPADFSKLFLFSACFYSTLPQIMISFGNKLKSIPGRITAQALKDHIHKILLHWRKNSIYMPSFIDSLIHNFSYAEEMRPEAQAHAATPAASIHTTLTSQPSGLPHFRSENVEGTPVTHYKGLAIDFDTLVNEEVVRLARRVRAGTPLDQLLPVAALKRAKT